MNEKNVREKVSGCGFISTLGGIRGGDLCLELSEDLQTVVQECMETGKKGALTLKLSVKRTGARTVEILEDVKLAVPRPSRSATVMFADDGGVLSENDPNQAELALKTVPIEKEKKKEAK